MKLRFGHHFYGEAILPDSEQEYIQALLTKYKGHPPGEDLKRKIWDELQREKALGKVTIPFKVVLRNDPTGKSPPYVEIILDTKV